jgi:hypothetical protein
VSRLGCAAVLIIQPENQSPLHPVMSNHEPPSQDADNDIEIPAVAGDRPVEPRKVFRWTEDMRELLRQMLEVIDRIVELNKLML